MYLDIIEQSTWSDFGRYEDITLTQTQKIYQDNQPKIYHGRFTQSKPVHARVYFLFPKCRHNTHKLNLYPYERFHQTEFFRVTSFQINPTGVATGHFYAVREHLLIKCLHILVLSQIKN